MKVSFRRPDQRQESLHPQQDQMREISIEKIAVGRYVLLAIAAVFLIYVLISIWRSTRIYGKGIVASHIESYTAPARSKLSGIYVQPGDTVNANEILFILISEDAQHQAEQVREQIRQEELALVELRQRLDRLQAVPALQTVRDLRQTKGRIVDLETNLATRKRNHESARFALQRQIRSLRSNLALRQDETRSRNEQAEQARLLQRLDAATSADVKRIESSARQAQVQTEEQRAALAQAEADLAKLVADFEADHQHLASQLNASQRYQETISSNTRESREQSKQEILTAIEQSKSRIKALQAEFERWGNIAGPTEFRAQEEGVVLEIPISDGAIVTANAPILSIANTGEIWVDAYLPTEQLDRLDEDAEAVIYASHTETRLKGRLTPGRLEVQVPSLLRLLDNNFKRATHVRIDLLNHQGELHPGNVVDVVIR